MDLSAETDPKPTGFWKRRVHPTSLRFANAIWSPPLNRKRHRSYPDGLGTQAADCQCHGTRPGCFAIHLERVGEIDTTHSADHDFRLGKASL